VRVLFGDRLTGTLQPNILAINSYYPYGMLIKSLSQNSETYRWGFQGHEQDNEIKGAGNHLRFGDYGYDTRLGRRWNLDPVDQVGISNYAVFKNNPIINVDPDGKQIRPSPARRGNNYNLRNYNRNYSMFYNGIQPKSTIQSTRYQRVASMTSINNEKHSYVQDIETAGGNNVQISNNNKGGKRLTFAGEFVDDVIRNFQIIKTVIYNPDGRIENRTDFLLMDIKDIEDQAKWELEYKELTEEIGQMPMFNPYDNESIKKVFEYQQTVRDRIGISPKQKAKEEYLLHPEKFEQVSTKKEIKPEFRKGGNL
jgi:RHS repeat-associated protein